MTYICYNNLKYKGDNIKTYILFILFFLNVSIAGTLTEQRATITYISDGDTFSVEIDGVSGVKSIRTIGIQTTEVNPDSTPNDCYADEATQRLTALTGVGSSVILKANNPNDIDRFGRLRRHLFIIDNDEEINIGKKLIEEGLALPLTMDDETDYDKDYAKSAQTAKINSLGLWSTIGLSAINHCPVSADSANSSFDIMVNFDANGDDSQNVNGEWVKITNTSGRSVDISKWWLRDSALYFFRFPNSTIIDDKEEFTIYVGKGTNTSNTFYWGNNIPIFDNTFDGVYLHDYLDTSSTDSDLRNLPRGNIKAAFLYPCLTGCTDPLTTKIVMFTHPNAAGDDNQNVNDEWVRITNISSVNINLENYLLHYVKAGSQTYFFDTSTVLYPNDELYLRMGKGTDSRLNKYVGRDTAIMANTAGEAWLTTMDSILISKHVWPSVDTDADGMLNDDDDDDDNDGVSDLDEIRAGTDPLDKYDKPILGKDIAFLISIFSLL